MSQKTKILEIKNISKTYMLGGGFSKKKLIAVNQVSLTLDGENPEIFTLAGESGSGKSTIAKIILGMTDASSGEILYKDHKMIKPQRRKDLLQFGQEIQPVFQNPFETFSPLKRVDTYLFETAYNYGLSSSRTKISAPVEEALALVGLTKEAIAAKFPNEFSGGQLQRISIARALITKPSLIIADEPVSMVDASLRMSIINLFKKLNEESCVSILYITHDLATAYYVSQHIAIMLRGNIVESGPSEIVLNEPRHPYTATLLQAVPTPDPQKKWPEQTTLPVGQENDEYLLQACKFAGRCPFSQPICREKDPEYWENGEVSVKCHFQLSF